MVQKKPIRILHVDDEKNQLDFTKLFLEKIDKEIEVDSVTSPEEAVKLHSKKAYDCVISDYKMLTMNGIELAQKVREKSSVPFILYTGQGSEEVAESAFEAGVDDYLRKETEPSHYQVLAKRVRQTVEKFRTEELYRKVVEESRDAIVILVGTNIAYINKAAIQIFGEKDADSYVGESILKYIIESEKELEKKLKLNVDGKEHKTNLFEINFRTSEGAIRTSEVSVSNTTYLGQDAYLCFIREITSRKRIEERLEAIHKQATKLGKLSDIKKIANSTLDIMESVFEFQTTSFHIVEDGYLKTLGVRGAPSLNLELPLDGTGVTVKAANEKRSILISNVAEVDYFFKGSTETKSELAVPAIINNNTVAVLNVESMKEADFTEDDRKLLETLALHVAIAFEKCLRESTDVDKEKDLDYAIGHLEDAEKITDLVKGGLQGTLKSIKNASGILVEQPDMYLDIAQAIDKNADHAVTVSDQIHETIMNISITAGTVEVNQIVREVLELVYIPSRIDINVEYYDHFLLVEINSNKFKRVIENIIQNSVEAMPEGGTLSISINVKNDTVEINVKDTGKGIPKDIKDRLFEPFVTSKENHSGLGLSYSKQIIEASNGKISAKSSSGKGATFTITLPIKK